MELEELWLIVGVSLASLFLGMTLISAGDSVAHLADNRITGYLRQALTRRLARVPLGWFTARASGEVKQAMQDDIGTLHSLTAHFFTTMGRSAGAVAISIAYLFFMDWRMAIISLLPFPLFFLFSARRTAPAPPTCSSSVPAWRGSTTPWSSLSAAFR